MNKTALKKFSLNAKALFISLFYDGIGPKPKWIERITKNDQELAQIIDSHSDIAKCLTQTSKRWAESNKPEPSPLIHITNQSTDALHGSFNKSQSFPAWGLAFCSLALLSIFVWHNAYYSSKDLLTVTTPDSQNSSIQIKVSSIVPPIGILGISKNGFAAVDTLSNSIKDSYLQQAEMQFEQTTKSVSEIPLKLFPEELVSSTMNLMRSGIN